MNVLRSVVVAAAVALAFRAGAQGVGEPPQQPPPGDSGSGSAAARRARELGQKGSDAAKRGAETARDKANQGGQYLNEKLVGTKTVSGQIGDVSPDEVTVKGEDGAPVKLRVTGSTKVTLDGRKAALGALREGDAVRASYAQSGGSATATQLEVRREGAPARPPAR